MKGVRRFLVVLVAALAALPGGVALAVEAANPALDQSLGDSGVATVTAAGGVANAVAVQPDGRILVGGERQVTADPPTRKRS